MTDPIRDKPSASPDERAVSPVIGVILMVAITVILAAVIGTFVLDLGNQVAPKTPQATLNIQDHTHNYDPDDDSGNESLIEISHDGGDAISGDEVKILVRNDSSNALLLSYDRGTITSDAEQDNTSFFLNGGGNLTASDDFSTGDVIEVAVGDSGSGWNGDDLGDKEKVVVQVIDTNTDNKIASATVRVS